MKLNKMHLLGIILMGLLIGSMGLLSSLGIHEQYQNINKPAKNPDFVCREIPKKQPRDIELGHYARTNDMTACPKDDHVHSGLLPDKTKKVLSHAQDDSNNVGGTTDMTNDQRLLAATLYADKKKNDPLTDDELRDYIAANPGMVSSMLNQGNKESFGNQKPSKQEIEEAIIFMRRKLANASESEKAKGRKETRFLIKLKELTEGQEGAKPDELQPWNKNKSKCGKFKANYGCLNIDTQNYNPINSERCGSSSLEGHRNRFTHQLTRNMIPRGRQEDYILKTKIVPPVCPKCPDCPALEDAIKLLQQKNEDKDKDGVEDELKDNELEDSPSALARANEKRKRTPEGQRSQDPAQNAPGVKEAAERHEPKAKNKPAGRKGAGYPNEGAFAGNSSFPLPFLNSFSSFGK
jgi:hypothetical protein